MRRQKTAFPYIRLPRIAEGWHKSCMRKLIASDFDGTIGTGGQLKKDIEAIEEFRRRGNLFGLVSGRNIAGLRKMRERTGVPVDFLLSDSGGTCYLGERLLFCAQASKEVFWPLVSYLMSRRSGLVAVNRVDGSDMLYYRHSDGREEYAPRRSEWTERSFPQMSGLFADYEACALRAKELEALFPRLTALPNDDCLDIVPKGRDKAVGVGELAGHFGVEKENIYVVGDNFNDLAMLRSYRSFAVANAPLEVQKCATMGVIPHVSDMIERVLKEE